MVNGEGDSKAGSGCHAPAVGMYTDNTEEHVAKLEPKAAKDWSQDSAQVKSHSRSQIVLRSYSLEAPMGDSGYSVPKFA